MRLATAAFAAALTACGGSGPQVIEDPAERTRASAAVSCCSCLVARRCFFAEYPAAATVARCVDALDKGHRPAAVCVAGSPDSYPRGVCTAACAAHTQETKEDGTRENSTD